MKDRRPLEVHVREPAIVASVLGADHANLGREAAKLEAAELDRIQWDVMDVGDAGAVAGVNRIGASAPGSVVLEWYGFTVNVAARALELLRTNGLSSFSGR